MSTPDSAPRVHALLLAAGSGSRFDPSGRTSKLLAKIAGLEVALHSARALAEAGLPVLAVTRETGALSERLRAEGFALTVCPDAELGMGHTLAHGVATLVDRHDPDAIVVALGDMPSIRPQTIRMLVQAVSAEVPIVVPEFEGKRGHPVVFWRACFDQLRTSSGDRGGAALLQRDTVRRVPVDDPAILMDIDRPADLADVQTRTSS